MRTATRERRVVTDAELAATGIDQCDVERMRCASSGDLVRRLAWFDQWARPDAPRAVLWRELIHDELAHRMTRAAA